RSSFQEALAVVSAGVSVVVLLGAGGSASTRRAGSIARASRPVSQPHIQHPKSAECVATGWPHAQSWRALWRAVRRAWRRRRKVSNACHAASAALRPALGPV